MSSKSVVIFGASGFGGAELIRRVLMHPHLNLLRVTSLEDSGKSIADVHKNLLGHTDLVIESKAPRAAVEGADIVFLGLPHHVSFKVAPELFEIPNLVLLDLSGDYRLTDRALYERTWGVPHPATGGIHHFTYGLPELFRRELKSANRIASPGCFATTITLGLAPLAAEKLSLRARTVALTGSSGSGSTPSAATHHPLRVNTMKSYRPLTHQQAPEVVQSLKAIGAPEVQLDFVPISAPVGRGIHATTLLDLPQGYTEKSVLELYRSFYEGSRFIRILSRRVPETSAVLSSNAVELSLTVDTQTRTLCVQSALDNLVKGSAGQSIQCLNLRFGWPEWTALNEISPYPY